METKEYYQSFADLYHLLSVGLSCPSKSFAVSLQSGVYVDVLSEILAPMEDASIIDSLEGLRSYAATIETDEVDSVRLRLEVEYNRLFVGPDQVLVPPYEAWYIPDASGATQLMSEVTARVVQSYRNAGIAPTTERKDMPDNLATELAFVSALARQAAAEDILLMDSFIDEHLSKWVQLLADRVNHYSNNLFYTNITSLTASAVALS